MARLWSSGFELQSVTANMEWTAAPNSGSFGTIITTDHRSGSAGGQTATPTSGTAKGFAYQFASATGNGPFYFRVYIKIGTLPNALTTVIGIGGANSTAGYSVNVRLDTAGKLGLYLAGILQGSISSTINDGLYHRVEVKASNTGVGTSEELYVDGVQIATSSSSPSGGFDWYAVGANIRADTDTASILNFDDIAINNTTGTPQNAYPGDGYIVHLLPNAQGDNNGYATAVGGTTGVANNYTRVNEIPPDDLTSYNQATAQNQIDDYNIDNTPGAIGASDTINLVSVGIRNADSSSSISVTDNVRLKSQASGTVTSGTSIVRAGGLTFVTNGVNVPHNPTLTSYTDPQAAGSWTKALLDTAQIGVTITSSGTAKDRVSGLWLLVDYTPAGIVPVTISVSDTSAVTDPFGKALSFDGTSGSPGYLQATDSASLQIDTSNTFTVAFWTVVHAYDNNVLPFFWNKFSDYMCIMGDSGNGKFRRVALAVTNNSSVESEFWGTTQLNVGQKYHIAATFDGSLGGTTQGKVYINGVEDGTTNITAWSGTMQATSGNDLFVAKSRSDLLRPYAGVMDEMIIYQSALSGSEVTNLYNGLYKAGYSALWHFDEGTGTTTADASGNSNTLSLLGTNTPVWTTPSLNTEGAVGVILNRSVSDSSTVTDTLTGITVVNPQIVNIQKTQRGSSTQVTSFAVDFSTNVTAGNFIAFVVGSANAAVSSVTDSLGNTYTRALAATTQRNLEFWYAQNITGGFCTVTANISALSWVSLAGYEYSGITQTLNPIDIATSTSANSSTPTLTTATTNYQNEAVVAMVDNGNNDTYTVGSYYQNLINVTDNAGAQRNGIEDKVISAKQPITATFTQSGAATWVMGVVTLIGANNILSISVNETSMVVDRMGTGTTYVAPVFTTPFNTTADFDSIQTASGETATISANNGYLGNSGRVSVTTANTEVSFRKALSGSNVRVIQFWFKVASVTSWSTSSYHNFFTTHDDAGWTNTSIGQIQLKQISSSTFKLAICDPSNAFTTTDGSTTLNVGTWYKVTYQITDSAINVYLNNNNATEVTQGGKSLSGKNIQSFNLGKFFSTGFAGTIDLDDLYCDVTPGTYATNSTKVMDTYRGFVQRFLSYDGAIVRPIGEGSGSTGSDIVSEGQGYILMTAVQMKDKTTFDLAETWTYNNLLRRNNGGLTTYLNMMAWHYDNITDSVIDWNYALDADMDRLLALLWAHYRWGSGGTINYKQRALDLGTDIKATASTFSSKQYLPTDITGVGATSMEQSTSYFDYTAARAMYQETGDTFWSQVIDGYYDVVSQVTANAGSIPTTKGLHPDWNLVSTTTGLVSEDTIHNSTRHESLDYGFNAFRAPFRIYWDQVFNGDSRAKTNLTGNFLTFMASEWTNNSSAIYAVYEHDGTVAPGSTYEKGQMYVADVTAWLSNVNAVYPAGNTGDTIISTKILPTYTTHAAGGYWGDIGGGGTALYFNTIWVIMGVATFINEWANWGYPLYAAIEAEIIDTVSVNDTSTVTENITVQVAGAITVSISISDSSTATDTLTQVLKIDNINVSDTSTATDVLTQILLTDLVNVSDNSTATDVIQQMLQIYLISVSDTSTATDVLQQILKIDNINVSDTSAVTESVTVLLPNYYINVSDTSAVTENSIVVSGDDENIFDTSTISESITVLLPNYYINVNDASAATESITVTRVNLPNVSDTSTASDVVQQMLLIDLINVSDTTAVSEFISFVLAYSLSVSDNSTATDVVQQMLITDPVNVSDTSGVTEVVTILLPNYYINVADASAVTESITIVAIDDGDIVDATTATDVVQQILVTDFLSVSDTSTATDVLQQILKIDLINVSDTTAVSEFISFTLAYSLSVSDNSTASDVVQQILLTDNINVSDTTSVSDVPTVVVIDLISVSDTSAATDVVTQILVTYLINTSDTSTVSEALTMNIPVSLSVSDSTTATDVPNVEIVYLVNVSDTTTATDSIQITIPIITSISDTVLAGDSLGYALQFDGVQNYLSLGSLGTLGSDLGSGFYTKFDIKTTQTTLGEFLIYPGTTGTGMVLGFNAVDLDTASAGYLTLWLQSDTSAHRLIGHTTNVTNFNDGAKHTIEFDADLTNNTINIIIDDISQAITYTQQTITTSVSDFPRSVNVAAYNNGSQGVRPLACIIDNFQIGTSSSNLYASYDFEDGTGPFATDITGNSNTATLKGVQQPIWVGGFESAAQVVITSNISVTDTTMVTESLTLTAIISILLTETSVVSEDTTVTAINLITPTDTSIVTDIITQILLTDDEILSDSTIVTEDLTLLLTNFVNSSDTTIVTDSLSIEQILLVNIAENSVSATEVIVLEEANNISVSDTTATSESLTVLIPVLFATVTDSTTVLESLTIIVIDEGDLVDATTVTDVVTQILLTSYINVYDGGIDYLTDENGNQILDEAGNPIIIEPITLTVIENIEVAPAYALTIIDTTIVTDTVIVSITNFITVTDNTIVTDTPIMKLIDNAVLSDNTTVSESITVRLVLLVRVTDTTSVTDGLSGQNNGIYLNPLDITIIEKVSQTPKLILVEGRLAYLIVDGLIPYYIYI